jgi:hypothetical protein
MFFILLEELLVLGMGSSPFFLEMDDGFFKCCFFFLIQLYVFLESL